MQRSKNAPEAAETASFLSTPFMPGAWQPYDGCYYDILIGMQAAYQTARLGSLLEIAIQSLHRLWDSLQECTDWQ